MPVPSPVEPSSPCPRGALPVALLLLLLACPAFALQPLSEFLRGAREANLDARAAALAVAQQEGESLASLGRTLPSFSARGTYTRNQFESKIDASQFLPPGAPAGGDTSLVIQPLNQLDAYLQLDVPLLDAAAWARLSAQHAGERAARQRESSTLLDVQRQVVRSYYQLVGAEALAESARRSLAAAEENLSLVRTRREGGVAMDLDVNRAEAEVARAHQSFSDAELTAELARRSLRTLTGLPPSGVAAAAPDDLREEAPLETFEQGAAGNALPQVAAAAEQRRSAEAAALAAHLAFLPQVSASATEHFTNATGFTGRSSLYVLAANLRWQLDLATLGTARAQVAAAEAARAREASARQAALDGLHEAWFRVHNGIARSRAARAAATSAQAAVARARERSRQGAGTQLELIQAERDAFSAEVSRLQADADLSYARAALRLQAGHPLDEGTSK